MKETVKLNHLSTPFQVDFRSLPKVLERTPAHWFKCIQEVLGFSQNVSRCAKVGHIQDLL